MFGHVDSFDHIDVPLRRIVFERAEAGRREPAMIAFATVDALDRRLRGRTLRENGVRGSKLEPIESDEILATADGNPVWLRRASHHSVTDIVISGPDELQAGEFLRDRISPGRMIELLPLIHFLREVTAAVAWTPTRPRAALVVDDPNLHWLSYGHLRYPELVKHARECNYHIAMAMVPLDAWYAHGRAVHLFRENADVVSLCVHGNDHRQQELAQPSSRAEAILPLASAMRRITAFETRTGLSVSRVMVPPHEACSSATMEIMPDLGFEAACATRPYLWVDFGTSSSGYNSPWPDHLLCGWRMTELMQNGFPVIIRRGFDECDDAILRKFLDQPIVLYGHVDDFANGLAVLERAASLANSLGDISWGPLSEIGASSFETRRRGATLHVRPFSRRVRLQVDPDVTEIELSPPTWVGGFDNGFDVHAQDVRVGTEGNSLTFDGERLGVSVIEIRWRSERELSHLDARRRPAGGAAAVVRRVLTETRDRLQPFAR